MTPVNLTSEITATLIDHAGDDLAISQAAWVSLGNIGGRDESRVAGLLNYLIKHRHGSPFEQGYLRFLIHCPIFVAREFVRHRIGVSVNEMSARYTELEPIFWMPREDRGLVNVGTSARPKMEAGPSYARAIVTSELRQSYENAWSTYTYLLNQGIANEVARTILPVGIYTRIMAIFNPRSLMHFLSLRIHSDEAKFATYPQAEIQELALAMEAQFADFWPLTLKAFVDNGRVSP